MRVKLLRSLPLLLALLVGCSAPKRGKLAEGAATPPTRAADGADPPWIRLQSEHFDLATDMSEQDAGLAVEALEHTRSALLSAAWNEASDLPTARTTVIVLRDGLEFMQYFEEAAALFSEVVRPTLVLWGKPDYWEARTGVNAEASSSLVRHELTHRIASSFYMRQPKWFAEGLAQYLQTLRVSSDGASATIGEVDPLALRRYRQSNATVRDVLRWDSYTADDPDVIRGYYGVSWLLVHYLFDERPSEFGAFQTALTRGESPEIAWKKAFGTERTDALDDRLADYARRKKYKTAVVPVERTSMKPPTRASITEADVHAIRAQLALIGGGLAAGPKHDALRREAAEELRRATRLEPVNPLAVRLLFASGMFAHDDPRLAAQLTAQLGKRPNDGEAWLLAAEWGVPSEREAAARKAVSLMPDSPEACTVLAWYLAKTGRTDEAIGLATKAVTLAPWSTRAHRTFAEALLGAGRCSEAIREQTRAIEVLPDGPTREPLVKEFERGLDAIKRECSKGAPPSTAPPPRSKRKK